MLQKTVQNPFKIDEIFEENRYIDKLSGKAGEF